MLAVVILLPTITRGKKLHCTVRTLILLIVFLSLAKSELNTYLVQGASESKRRVWQCNIQTAIHTMQASWTYLCPSLCPISFCLQPKVLISGSAMHGFPTVGSVCVCVLQLGGLLPRVNWGANAQLFMSHIVVEGPGDSSVCELQLGRLLPCVNWGSKCPTVCVSYSR